MVHVYLLKYLGEKAAEVEEKLVKGELKAEDLRKMGIPLKKAEEVVFYYQRYKATKT